MAQKFSGLPCDKPSAVNPTIASLKLIEQYEKLWSGPLRKPRARGPCLSRPVPGWTNPFASFFSSRPFPFLSALGLGYRRDESNSFVSSHIVFRGCSCFLSPIVFYLLVLHFLFLSPSYTRFLIHVCLLSPSFVGSIRIPLSLNRHLV